jgi:nitroreductase
VTGASGLDLTTVDKLLTTTRAVRKRLDLTRSVELEVILECLRLAIQAPTGSNMQTWRWIVVTDPAVRAQLAEIYQSAARGATDVRRTEPAMPETPQQQRVMDSADYLMEHIAEVPVLVIPCIEEGGGPAGWAPSIYPAAWSFMLALRSRGLGSVITTVHLYRREAADELLGVPEGFVQACMLPVAYYTGDDFKPADRRPIEELAFLNHWETPITRHAQRERD